MSDEKMPEVVVTLLDKVGNAIERAADALSAKWNAEAAKAQAEAKRSETLLELAQVLTPSVISSITSMASGKKEASS